MKRLITLVIMLLCMSFYAYTQQAQQEIVYLKNGSVIKGVIIEQIPNESLKIQTADGSIFSYQMTEVEKITKEVATRQTAASPFKTSSAVYYEKQHEIGYRGFVDFGYTIGTGDHGTDNLQLTTSHGYQFNPYLFLGFGTGVHYYLEGADAAIIPVFTDIRGNFMTGTIVPFIGFKFGYSINTKDDFKGLGIHFSPTAGVKLMVTPTTALNFTLGYSYQKANIFYYSGGYYYKTKGDIGGFSLKIGVEF